MPLNPGLQGPAAVPQLTVAGVLSAMGVTSRRPHRLGDAAAPELRPEIGLQHLSHKARHRPAQRPAATGLGGAGGYCLAAWSEDRTRSTGRWDADRGAGIAPRPAAFPCLR